MVSVPDRPWPPGGRPGRQPDARRQAVARCRAARWEPATSLSRLLLGQGIGWLLLSVAGLTGWSASFPGKLSLSGGDAVFWAGVELLAIAMAAGFGAAEVGMACRMRGGPRLLVAMTGKLQGTMLAVALILAALLVMVGGSMLELMALGKLVPGVAPGGSLEPSGTYRPQQRWLRRIGVGGTTHRFRGHPSRRRFAAFVGHAGGWRGIMCDWLMRTA
jgi:hypothetical protein